ncbi:MAG: hypothetical protein WBQ58_03480, partial [Methanoregula sp.]
YLDIDKVHILRTLQDMALTPVIRDPVKIAETSGRQVIEVYQGDLRCLDRVIPRDAHPVAAIDIFDKGNKTEGSNLVNEWRVRMGGEAFIP